jgi:hypothetical protein
MWFRIGDEMDKTAESPITVCKHLLIQLWQVNIADNTNLVKYRFVPENFFLDEGWTGISEHCSNAT